MKVITVGLRKGGVSKTTTATLLAAELAKHGKTLLIDADPQGNASSVFLKEINTELVDVLTGKLTWIEAGEETFIKNLFILPTSPLSNKLNMYKRSPVINSEPFIFDDLVKSLGNEIEYVVIDTCPDFSQFEENIYFATDELVTVVTPDVFGSDGLLTFSKDISQFMKNKRKSNLSRKVLVCGKYNASLKSDTEIKELLEKNNDYKVITIPQDQDIKNSQMERRLPKNKKTLEAFEKLAEILK